ncbi:MAG: hypothetical protein GF331_17895 [Chitinivibrionales bacterium]|nr:hypothetical protein [Chitinivibrionales bacterium]
MTTNKTVITGVNALSALGTGYDALSANLGTAPAVTAQQEYEFHSLDTALPAYRIPDYDPVAVLGKKGLRTKDWPTKLLLGTIEQAFKDILESADPESKPGLCIGTAFGSVQSIGDFLSDSIVNGVNAVNPMKFGNTVINAPTGNANIRFGIRSLSSTVASGYNASMDALVYATDHIRCGYLESILVGGLEEVSYYGLVGLLRSGVLSKAGVSRPFAADGDGLVMGEGCAVCLLESADAATARGATVLAEIAGTAATFDRGSAGGFNPHAAGALAAVKMACEDAGIAPSDIGFVAANANGLRPADAMEATVLRELLPDTPVVAYKSRIGECYGASSALVTACALADMAHGTVTGIPAEYNVMEGLDLVVDRRTIDAEYVLVNSYSCDGNCGSIVLKRPR